MPELRTDSDCIPTYNHIMDAEKPSEFSINDDIESFSTLHDVSLPDLSHSPLPLQCLAAEALPDNVKQEIEELTNSSVEEYRQSSNEKQQPEKQQTDAVATSKQVKEYTVTVPLQFFTNGHGLRIVGGVDCQHTGERHAQIVCLKFAQETNVKNTEGGINRRPELLASLHNGLCVLELEGHSLRGASFEDVRRIMKTIRSAVVKLVVKDCKGLSTHLVSTSSDKGMLPKGKPEQPHILTMRRQYRTKYIQQRKHRIITSTSNEYQTGNTRSPEHKNHMTKKTSTQSFDSTTSLGSEISMSSLLEEFCSNLPTGMAKLSLRYSKSQEMLHVNLHKLKGQSKSNPTEQSSAFLNTYLFPDKRSQGVKYCKLVPAKASTDDILENSASYILTEDELSNLSLRVIIWESSNTIRSKKPQFKGEVFLNINDSDIVNLHGVPQWYTICQPDRNLPVLPNAYQIQQQGTLIKKMKASWANTTQTIGVMTLRRMMKGENNLGSLRSQSLQDISKQDPKEKIKTLKKLTNFPAVLEPLKEGNVSSSLSESRLSSRSSNRGSIASVFELGRAGKEKEELSLMPPLSQPLEDPPSPFSDRRMSIYEFLEALNTEVVDSENSTKTEAPNPKFSNFFHNGIPAKPDSIKSSSSCGEELCYRRMSLLSFLASLDRPNSQVSQTGSEFSQESSLTCSSDSSSISSVCAFKNGHLKGWSEEKQSEQPSESDSSTLSLSNSTQHSIIVSNPIGKCHSFADSFELDTLLSLSPDTPSDEMFKPIATKMSTPVKKSSCDHLPLISINDEPPHRAESIHSSTETLISQHPVDTSSEFEAMTRIRSVSLDTPTRQTENLFDNSQKSDLGWHLSKSADDLLDLMEKDSQVMDCGKNESTLDIAEYQRNPLNSSDASLDRSATKSRPVHNQKRNLRVVPSPTNTLESIPKQKQISNDKFVDMRSGKKPSKSLGHKWLSMDNLLQSASSEKSATKKVHKGQQKKRDNIGVIRRLVHAYETAKPAGSVHLQVTAKYVAGEVSVKVLDVVFYSHKLMNTDFVVNVNLYNRFSEESEISKKGHMAIRKNGMFESKQIPPMFEFSGNPSVYFIQMIFQTGSRVFGHRSYYAMIDIKETIAKSDATMWFQLSKLP